MSSAHVIATALLPSDETIERFGLGHRRVLVLHIGE